MSIEIKIAEKTTINLEPPKMWKVIFHNDDKTPMEFVIELLVSIFKHDVENAKMLTLEIHNTGHAVVGVYSHEIAEQRGVEATQTSRSNGFPLQINLEEEN